MHDPLTWVRCFILYLAARVDNTETRELAAYAVTVIDLARAQPMADRAGICMTPDCINRRWQVPMVFIHYGKHYLFAYGHQSGPGM